MKTTRYMGHTITQVGLSYYVDATINEVPAGAIYAPRVTGGRFCLTLVAAKAWIRSQEGK